AARRHHGAGRDLRGVLNPRHDHVRPRAFFREAQVRRELVGRARALERRARHAGVEVAERVARRAPAREKELFAFVEPRLLRTLAEVGLLVVGRVWIRRVRDGGEIPRDGLDVVVREAVADHALFERRPLIERLGEELRDEVGANAAPDVGEVRHLDQVDDVALIALEELAAVLLRDLFVLFLAGLETLEELVAARAVVRADWRG